MKFPVETLVFDFDGVLVDTGPDIANAANETMEYLGLPTLAQEVVVGYIGGGAERLLRRCLKEQADSLIGPALSFFGQRYEEKCCVETRLYPYVLEVLAHYRELGKHMVIATQKNEAITRTILNTLDFASYFELIVGPESVTHRKPHPESVLLALEKTKSDSGKAVMIGDTASDIQAGKAAGTLTCGVLYGYGTKEEVLGAHPEIVLEQTLRQLLEWIE